MVPCSSHLDFLSAFQTYQTCSRPRTFAVVGSSARNVLAQISMWLTLINGVNLNAGTVMALEHEWGEETHDRWPVSCSSENTLSGKLKERGFTLTHGWLWASAWNWLLSLSARGPPPWNDHWPSLCQGSFYERELGIERSWKIGRTPLCMPEGTVV